MDHSFFDVLSNGDNESINEDRDNFLTPRKSRVENDRKNPLWSSKMINLTGSETSVKNQIDIDVDYAIGLLKINDRNVNV